MAKASAIQIDLHKGVGKSDYDTPDSGGGKQSSAGTKKLGMLAGAIQGRVPAKMRTTKKASKRTAAKCEG